MATSRGLTRDSSLEDIHSALMSDPYLYAAYSAMYGDLLSEVDRCPAAGLPVLELGGAPGFVKELRPTVIVSDVVPGTGVDVVATAENLPFEAESLRAIIVKDVLHHMRDVRAFMSEAQRTLVPGGAVIALEPYWGVLAGTIYRYLHPEPFDPKARAWGVEGDDRWHSNQALAYILLRRDRRSFEDFLAGMTIEELGYRTGPSYLLSGGLYSRTPLPAAPLLGLLRAERRLSKWLRPISLHVFFVIRKA